MSVLPRILSTLGILLVIGVVALWIMGGKKSDNHATLDFDVSAKQIFPYLTEPDLVKQWFSGLVSIDPVQPPEEGSKYQPAMTTMRVIEDSQGNRTQYRDQVLRFTPNRMLSVKSMGEAGNVTWIYQLDPKTEGRTKVTFRIIKSAGGTSRIFAPLQQDVYLQQIETDIRQLKAAVERAPNAGTPLADEPTNNSQEISTSDEVNPDTTAGPLVN